MYCAVDVDGKCLFDLVEVGSLGVWRLTIVTSDYDNGETRVLEANNSLLVGAIAILLLFLLLLWRLFVIAVNAPDLYGSLIAVGVLTHIAVQVIINVAVVTNTMPSTGIPLPFISYGGSSLVALLFEMGIALGVSNQIEYRE